MIVRFPCKICCKPVANSDHAIQCDNCNIWVHVKCNRINTVDFLGISEIYLKLNRNLLNHISMPGYNIEHTLTDSSNSGTLLYIKQGINYKLQKDLQIYQYKNLNQHL